MRVEFELAPGFDVQVPPQTGAVVDGVPAKPLNEAVAEPPERLFRLDQLFAHQVTLVDGEAEATVLSPSVNAPLVGKAKMVACASSVDARL